MTSARTVQLLPAGCDWTRLIRFPGWAPQGARMFPPPPIACLPDGQVALTVLVISESEPDSCWTVTRPRSADFTEPSARS